MSMIVRTKVSYVTIINDVEMGSFHIITVQWWVFSLTGNSQPSLIVTTLMYLNTPSLVTNGFKRSEKARSNRNPIQQYNFKLFISKTITIGIKGNKPLNKMLAIHTF